MLFLPIYWPYFTRCPPRAQLPGWFSTPAASPPTKTLVERLNTKTQHSKYKIQMQNTYTDVRYKTQHAKYKIQMWDTNYTSFPNDFSLLLHPEFLHCLLKIWSHVNILELDIFHESFVPGQDGLNIQLAESKLATLSFNTRCKCKKLCSEPIFLKPKFLPSLNKDIRCILYSVCSILYTYVQLCHHPLELNVFYGFQKLSGQYAEEVWVSIKGNPNLQYQECPNNLQESSYVKPRDER